MKKFYSPIYRFICLAGALFLVTGCDRTDVTLNGEMLNNLDWRAIGPATFAGRISDIAVNPVNRDIIFVSPSTGGIFRSHNAGDSWEPVFDRAGNTLAIGAIYISPSDPDIIWAGTGEASGEQSPASIGDGVYRSLDGGNTWKNMGLNKTRHISRVVIHPEDPETVFVGATGSRWGACDNRGVYRTRDGGESWERVLFINENTGISDLLIMPDGKTLFASAWEQRRNAWAHVRMGPGSGLYRSADAGDSWEKVEGGLPRDNIGRIAIATAPSDSRVMYAALEHDSLGFFRSDDGGLTWSGKNERVRTSYWYGRIYVDPVDAERVWVMGTMVQETTDGGESFHPVRMSGVHVDHHVAWFDPADTNHIILGNDGGLYFTHDRGISWDFVANLPIGQYYDISIDARSPYRIYGGLQDNGVWGGPSRSETGKKVSNSDIYSISGGDGFYSASEPSDPDIVYGESQYGFVTRRNLETGERKMVRPVPEEGKEYRFNWNTPLFISTHAPNLLFIGGNRLFMSDDMGETVVPVSPDLSRDLDLDSLLVIGLKPVLKPYCSITALSESPLRKGLIYAGTDDGNLHVTTDGGMTWEEITANIPAPEDRFFTRLCASMFDEATAYAAFGRFYEADDLSPYLFKTSDNGKTWVQVTGDLPDEAIVTGFAEYPGDERILFAGVHNGLFVSANGGENWSKVNGPLPNVAVNDIVIDPEYNDLILGTYGRGIWILDDISFLEGTGEGQLNAGIYLFYTAWIPSGISADSLFTPEKYTYVAPEPPSGLVITWYNKKETLRSGKLPALTLTDNDGVIRYEATLTGKKGINRISVGNLELEPGDYLVEIKGGRWVSSQSLTINE